MLNIPVNENELLTEMTELLKKHGVSFKTARLEVHIDEGKVKILTLANLKIATLTT